MAAAPPPPWPHAIAATRTRVPFPEKAVINVTRKSSNDMCSLRIRGELILSHGSCSIGPNGWFVDVTDPVVMKVKLDHRRKVYRPDVFSCVEVCLDLIHEMLDVAPATSEHDHATGNWVDPIYTPHPHDIATAIVRFVSREREIDEMFEAAVCGRPGYHVDIEIPQLSVTLVCTEPKELLLACKEPAADTVAARVSARRRKGRRREPACELCAICLLDFLETEQEEAVRLPCSHPFHSGCIEPWLHRAWTCPTCRSDIMELTVRR